jgi:hypothetical protein
MDLNGCVLIIFVVLHATIVGLAFRRKSPNTLKVLDTHIR